MSARHSRYESRGIEGSWTAENHSLSPGGSSECDRAETLTWLQNSPNEHVSPDAEQCDENRI